MYRYISRYNIEYYNDSYKNFLIIQIYEKLLESKFTLSKYNTEPNSIKTHEPETIKCTIKLLGSQIFGQEILFCVHTCLIFLILRFNE